MILLKAFISKLILAHFEYFIIGACIDIALQQKFFTKKKLLFFPFILIGVCCNMLIPNPAIGVPLGSIIGITLYMVYIDDKLINNVILYFMILMLHTLIQLVLFMWLPQSLLTNFYFLIGAFIITFLVSYPIIKFLPFRKLYKLLTEKNIIITILFFNVALVVIFHNTYYSINMNDYYAKLAVILVIIALGILANIYCIINYLKQKKQQAMLDAYNTWLPIVEQLIVQIRTIQHNYDNEMQTFKALPLIHKDVNELKKAIMSYVRQIINEDIPLEITLDYIPDAEMTQCIEELQGTIIENNNSCIITYNTERG